MKMDSIKLASLFSVFLVWATACTKDKTVASQSTPEAAQNTEFLSAQTMLLQKRAELLNLRQGLQAKRVALSTQRQFALSNNKSIERFQKREQALLEEENTLAVLENQLLEKESKNILTLQHSQKRNLAIGDKKTITSTPVSIEKRRRDLSQMENKQKLREGAMVQQEISPLNPSTQKKELVVQEGNDEMFTLQHVESLKKLILRERRQKGILRSDLPKSVQSQERRLHTLLKEGNFGQAGVMAALILSDVFKLRINNSFVLRKLNRLGNQLGSTTLSAQNVRLLREASLLYEQSKYERANTKLNKVINTISKKDYNP